MWCLDLFEEMISSLSNLTPALIMGLGLMVGIEHAFEPDHLSAVGTQLFQKKSKKNGTKNKLKTAFRKSSLVGVFWGAGHTTTLVTIGFLTYYFAITLQSEIFEDLELLVGAMLIFLGITTVWKKKFKIQHRHPHHHSDGNLHFDAHEHSNPDHRHGHKSYLIGLIHGLAGSGSLIVLATATFDNMEMALAFTLLFGLGSIAGMILVSGLIGLPILLTNRISLVNRFFRYGTAVISFVIGTAIIFEIRILNNFL